jgi:lysyl-tRNA synthetase class II
MAEKSSSLDDNATSSKRYVIPSNEEIINELTKDLFSSSIQSAEETNSVRYKHNEIKLKEDNNVGTFEEDVTRVSAGDSDKLENEEDHVEVEDDFIDEVILKDFEITYSTEDKEVLNLFIYIYIYIYMYIQGAAEITPTFRKIAVGSPKQVVGCGPFR